MNKIKENIQKINQQIEHAASVSGRKFDSVQLLAVSKTKPTDAILEAAHTGQTDFGENYVQEGISKVLFFVKNHPDLNLNWHFIGPIQSNKTRDIAEHFDWVHSIDREKIAQRLNDQRPDSLPPLQVLIQVNTSGEINKSGIDDNSIFQLAEVIASLPNLTLRGLMSIPQNVPDHTSQLIAFNQLAVLKQKLAQKYPNLDTLSMGMSQDMPAAIEAGSTIVRIGTAIFGSREPNY